MAVHHRNGNEEVTIVLGKGSKDLSAVQRQISNAVNELIGDVDELTQEVFDEVGQEAVNRLRTDSESRKWRKYARGWKYEKQKTIKGKRKSLVRNTTQPQLTHLLEYGHPIFNQYGETKGQAKAIEHIKPVNDWVQSELPKKLEEKIKHIK